MKELIMKIRDQEVVVEVTQLGQFSAVLAGKTYVADRWEDLRQRLMTASKRAAIKVAVPFVIFRSNYPGDGYSRHTYVATGIHQGTQNILARNSVGTAIQLDGWETEGALRPLTGEEQDRYVAALIAQREAKAAVDRLKVEFGIDVRRTVRAAIEKELGA